MIDLYLRAVLMHLLLNGLMLYYEGQQKDWIYRHTKAGLIACLILV